MTVKMLQGSKCQVGVMFRRILFGPHTKLWNRTTLSQTVPLKISQLAEKLVMLDKVVTAMVLWNLVQLIEWKSERLLHLISSLIQVTVFQYPPVSKILWNQLLQQTIHIFLLKNWKFCLTDIHLFKFFSDQNNSSIILGTTIPIIIIAMLFVGVFVYKKRRGKRTAETGAHDSMSLPDSVIETSRPVRIENFSNHYRMMSADSDFR